MILNLDAKFPKEVLDMNASADDRYIYCVTEKSIKIYDTEEKAIIHELKKTGERKDCCFRRRTLFGMRLSCEGSRSGNDL